MIPHHIYYQLVIVGLLWLCVMLHYVWPSQDAVSPQPPVQPMPPPLKRKRFNEPKPFVGLTQRPHCALCEYETNHPEPQPPRATCPHGAAHPPPSCHRHLHAFLPSCGL